MNGVKKFASAILGRLGGWVKLRGQWIFQLNQLCLFKEFGLRVGYERLICPVVFRLSLAGVRLGCARGGCV